jgi:hypothetical protein
MKTRLAVLMVDNWTGRDGVQAWAGAMPLERNFGWRGIPLAVFRVPLGARFYEESWCYAKSTAAASRSVRRWLKSVGAVEIAR